MNILIPNNWLKDYLETNATPKEFADAMSLTSVSIEHMEKVGDDVVFDIEVTTNRPDLMSIEGIAREASAILPQAGFKAVFKPYKSLTSLKTVSKSPLLSIQTDPKLINRICAVVMEIRIAPSPAIISERLEKTGIRSINSVVDTTNYIMRELGHPSHVFDYDRLLDHTLIIRSSKKGEKITTLDGKVYILSGNDIVADNGHGEIVDLLGIMGTANSVVVPKTKRVVLFLDNNEPHLLRKTSMNLGIRTEAAVLNEKGLDPQLMMPTLLRGIELLEKNANGKVVSDIIDIYPNKPTSKPVTVSFEKINSVIGITIPEKTVTSILSDLGFEIRKDDGKSIEVLPPFFRLDDIKIPEDIIEEVARVYGYNKIPNSLPPFNKHTYYHQQDDEFYWVQKVKEAMLFWGFTETYTYSLVSEELYDGPIEKAIKLKNPLTEDRAYLRNSLTPSLLEVISVNKSQDSFKLFEIANVYLKKNGLPDERLHMATVLKDKSTSFYEAKGIVEQILRLMGVTGYRFENKEDGLGGATIFLSGKNLGTIDMVEEVTFELDITEMLKHAKLQKKYAPPSKFPTLIEDIRIEIAPHYPSQKVREEIKKTSPLIHDVSLLDIFENKKTFRITFLDRTRSLKSEDIKPLRENIYKILKTEFKAIIG